jgi:hypothetical protein
MVNLIPGTIHIPYQVSIPQPYTNAFLDAFQATTKRPSNARCNILSMLVSHRLCGCVSFIALDTCIALTASKAIKESLWMDANNENGIKTTVTPSLPNDKNDSVFEIWLMAQRFYTLNLLQRHFKTAQRF